MAQAKNPMIEVNKRAMEYIWRTVPKEEKNGVPYVTYVKGDIPYLYYSGLVDTDRYTPDDWQKAFDPFLGEDGRYWISHEVMIALGRFRYARTLNEPFDPLKMRTGKYSVDRLWNLYERSVIPSCVLPKEYLKNVFDQIVRQKKELGQFVSKDEAKNLNPEQAGLLVLDENQRPIFEEESVVITREHLLNIKKLLDMYPSPRRKMEVAVYETRAQKLQEMADIAAKPQKSHYEAGPDFRKTAQTSLKDMLVKASENPTGGRKPLDEVIDLKAMKKKKRPPTKF